MIKKRILCVDDESMNLELLKAILTPLGYDILTANTGKEGFENLLGGGIDLVILDVSMPDMNGYEVCKKIKHDERTSGIPVVLLSGLSDTEEMNRGFSMGCDDFLSKPFERVEFIGRIKSVLTKFETE